MTFLARSSAVGVKRTRWYPFPVLALIFGAACGIAAAAPDLFHFRDSTGDIAIYTKAEAIDTSNPFSKRWEPMDEHRATCHPFSSALSFSADDARTRFAHTRGADPLFADVDGANCSGVDRSDASAHSLILENGLIRIALPVPSAAQFTIDTIYDPSGCADITDPVSGQRQVSVYRRPLPTTNLRFLSAVMYCDGRETVAPLNDASTFRSNLRTDLTHQALDATLGHAQASTPPTERQLAAIVRFELALFTTQATDDAAGSLSRRARKAARSASHARSISRHQRLIGIESDRCSVLEQSVHGLHRMARISRPHRGTGTGAPASKLRLVKKSSIHFPPDDHPGSGG